MNVEAGGSGTAAPGPYKGLDSFRSEDADFFFGRDREAEQLIAAALSARLLVLHAPSGAGKTSLLHARVLPGLEARGSLAVHCRPEDDPSDAVRRALLWSLLPPMTAEVSALERALAALAPGEEVSLGQLLERYDARAARHVERRRLVAPVAATAPALGIDLPMPHRVTPYFCRVLRSSFGLGRWADHLRAVSAHAPAKLGFETSAIELAGHLAEPRLAADYAELLERLDPPVPGLRAFFENLLAVYGGRRRGLGVVLVLDQFEELFTRFADAAPSTESPSLLLDWRLREAFFDELEALLRPDRRTGALLPVRIVLAIRDEFVARLDPVYRWAPARDRLAYHLRWLDRAQAREAIQRPAAIYGVRYATDCYDRLIAQLLRENRHVEPAHLQIVCDKLWHQRGRGPGDDGEEGDPHAEVTLSLFEALGETRGIFDAFFRDLLGGLDDDERREALEMLALLVTPRGTRNIVGREALVEAPLRSRERRQKLLDVLAERRVLRAEPRLGSVFVEITHEFLIGPILATLVEEVRGNPAYARFRELLASLGSLRRSGFREMGDSPFDTTSLRLLAENRDAVDWDDLGAELILRSALLEGLARQELAVWIEVLRSCKATPTIAEIVHREGRASEGRALLALDELRELERHRETLEPDARELERIVRSYLVRGGGEERAQIAWWTRRWAQHGT